jgi:hypothetical protein
MKPFYYIFTSIFLFLNLFCHAQLDKGTKTIGYGGSISASFNRQIDKHYGYSNKSNSQGMGVNYSVGSFISKKWLVGGGIGVSYRRGFDNQTQLNLPYNTTSKGNYISYDVSTFTRFYLKNEDRKGAFLFANLLDYGELGSYRQMGSTSKTEKNNANSFNWTAGMGIYKMLNNQIAAEGTLSYSHRQINLNASLLNFIKPDEKTSQDASPQYIAKNRWLADPNFNLYYYTTAKTLGLSIGGLAGKMVSDKIMAGSGVAINFYTTSYYLGISPFIRYYIPITNRLFVFPYIGSSMSINKSGDGKNSNINFNRGIGYNYFITHHIALSGIIDAKWTNSHSYSSIPNTVFDYKYNEAALSIHAGISYFLQ